MLYVIHGTDTDKVRKKTTQLVEMLQKKRPDASLFRVNQDTWREDFLEEIIPSISLFSPKNIIVLDFLFDNEEAAKKIIDNLSHLKETEHVCIVAEGKLTKEELKKLTAKAEKVEEHNKGEVIQKKESPKTFALASALIEKNNRKAFEIFQELQKEGIPTEEIHGVMWWQFKALYLTVTTKSAKEADLNPFVYSNCKRVANNWSPEVVSKYLERLMDMYHKAHRGGLDFIAELELLTLR